MKIHGRPVESRQIESSRFHNLVMKTLCYFSHAIGWRGNCVARDEYLRLRETGLWPFSPMMQNGLCATEIELHVNSQLDPVSRTRPGARDLTETHLPAEDKPCAIGLKDGE